MEQLHSFQDLSSSLLTNDATKKPSNTTGLYCDGGWGGLFCMEDMQEFLSVYLTYLAVALALAKLQFLRSLQLGIPPQIHTQPKQTSFKENHKCAFGSWGCVQ